MNYEEMSLAQLKDIAKELKIKSAYKLKKIELLEEIKKVKSEIEAEKENENVSRVSTGITSDENQNKEEKNQHKNTDGVNQVCGILEILTDGFGFLRTDNYLSGTGDVYVSPTQIRRFNLKTGDEVSGKARFQKDEKFPALIYVDTVNGDSLDVSIKRKPFSSLTPIYPDKRIPLHTNQVDFAMRLIGREGL